MHNEFEKICSSRLNETRTALRGFLKSFPEDSELAESLELALAELLARGENVAREVGERLAREIRQDSPDARSKLEKIWNVATVLAPAADERSLASRGFSPMPAPDPRISIFDKKDILSPFILCFLKTPYSEIHRHLHVPFNGKCGDETFRYELVPYTGFLPNEKILADIAFLYGIKRPLIFSPWARRAAMVNPVDGIWPKGKIDLEPAANRLEDVLLTDHCLYWNISASPLEDSSGGKEPSPHDPSWKYFFTDVINDGTFVLPDMPPDAGLDLLEAIKYPGRIEILSRVSLAKYERVDITPPVLANFPKNTLIFTNECKVEQILGLERPRTRGEVNLALASLAQYGFRGELLEGNAEPLDFYDASLRYPEPNPHLSLYDARMAKMPCPVRFTGDPLFLEDYAAYVLSYLSRRYPEFNWKGCR